MRRTKIFDNDWIEVAPTAEEFDNHLDTNASTSQKGHTQLSSSISSTSQTLSATPYAVKQAYDKAVDATSVVGTFVGSGGSQPRNVNLGFKPKFLIVTGQVYGRGSNVYSAIVYDGLSSSTISSSGFNHVIITNNGFTVNNSSSNDSWFNVSGFTYHYIAFK